MPTRYIHARLIDGTGADPVDDVTITVDDGRFVAIDHSSPGTEDAVVDLEGRTVLPGLISAHTHLAGIAFTGHADAVPAAEVAAWTFEHLRRSLDLGFTTCRETAAMDGGVVSALNKGLVEGPRMLVCGPALVQMGGHADFRPAYVPDPCLHHQGTPGLAITTHVCDGVDAVRAAARLAFKRGATFLKMCATGGVTSASDALEDTQFTIAEMRAAVEEARARRTYVTIHTHNNAGIMRGLEAGVECFEHCTALDEETADAVAAAGAAIVPTLTVAHVYATFTDFLEPDVIARIAGVEEGMGQAIRLAHSKGILVGAGADLIGPDQKDFGLETALVAEHVGAMQAIVTTTRDNARVLRIDDRLGTVVVGKEADLVAVDGDPLDDPRLLSDPGNITLVVQAGAVKKDRR